MEDILSRSLDDLQSEVKTLALELIDRANQLDIEAVVTSTLRSFKEQQALYDQGRKSPGKVVTNAQPGSSYHNFGLAFDIAFRVGGKITWDGPWETVGAIGRSIGLRWGGDFQKFKDRPHFESGPSLKECRQKWPLGWKP